MESSSAAADFIIDELDFYMYPVTSTEKYVEQLKEFKFIE